MRGFTERHCVAPFKEDKKYLKYVFGFYKFVFFNFGSGKIFFHF